MDYWSRVLTQRIDRRRAIAGTAGLAAGAAILTACGGSDSSSKPSTSKAASVVEKNVDETKTAKRGGKYTSSWPTPPSQDPHGAGPGQMTFSYATLVRIAPGNLAPTDGTVEGYALDSWEISPDKL